MNRVVLDSAGFDALTSQSGGKLRYLLKQSLVREGELWCAAVTLAEVARGTVRTREVDVALSREHSGKPINVLVTDVAVARIVGSILHSAGRGSADLADAHVVAACIGADVAIVVTSDPDDIIALGDSVPGVRIVTRSANGGSHQ